MSYNASQAARELGVPDKTIRRWLKQGLSGRWKLTAVRTASGQLEISEADVERIKRERERDRSRFAKPSPAASGLGMPSQDMATLSKQMEALTARVRELEQKVAELESALSRQPASSPDHQKRLDMTTPPSPTAIPADLPEGTLHSTAFAEKLGMDPNVLGDCLRRGIARGKGKGKDYLEHIEVPSARRGHVQRYLSPPQQRKAEELLRKHGKI
jgi:DNA-binding transcriptional MerR regulator